LATNAAMVLAGTVKEHPMALAERIGAALAGRELATGDYRGSGFTVAAAKPGFINIRLAPEVWHAQLRAILRAGTAFGDSAIGGGARVNVEFVSANPTGPLHVAHGRGAVVGDALAGLLSKAGFRVSREYYVNDAGNQVRLFGESIQAAIRGQPAPEGGYRGAYVEEIARAAAARLEKNATVEALAEFGIAANLESIRRDLDRLRIAHHAWFSERSLYHGWDQDTMARLRSLGRVVERDGAVWFVTGGDKDEVLYKRTGEPTYFAADIFYHRDKLEKRGYQRVVDVWGADHQGQVNRLKQALEVLGIDPARLTVILVQLVSVRRGTEIVRMSRRSGVGITLEEMLDEVGPDAVRYFFLLRSSDAHMEFDVDLAKQQSNENPVFYAQYAHARLSNVRKFGAAVQAAPAFERLGTEWELDLLRAIVRWPDVVREAAESLEPHRLAFYANELAARIHVFYKNVRVVIDDQPVSAARLRLSEAARVTLANALDLMGVAAPERM
ncbi:MAG TPA: arginine--tRNA ligase, partial [Candidatus Eisenbacteria bacterium]|nr:arginine--tRNA ligase [Candidatus Eisenbacteria bacterium]